MSRRPASRLLGPRDASRRRRGARLLCAGLAVVLVVAPSVLAGQPLHPGQLVRLSAPGAGFVRDTVRVISAAADSLVVGRLVYRAHDPVPVLDTVRTALALSDVQRLEVRESSPGLMPLGAVLGLAGGAAAGAALGRASGDSPCGLWFVFCYKLTARDKATIYGILGGGLGLGVGTFVAWRIGREHWKAVPLRGLHVGAKRLPADRVGVGAAVEF